MPWKQNDFITWLTRKNDERNKWTCQNWQKMNIFSILKQKQPILKNFMREYMGSIPKKHLRFEIISKLSKKYHIRILFQIAEVSQSWYYKWKKTVYTSQTKEYKEQSDLQLIQEISSASKQKYGYRMIAMMLCMKGILMNHKKVLRLMNKYDLLAKARRRNPYKQIMKRTQQHRVAPNILSRAFQWFVPLRKLWTDITYLRFKWRWIYLSIVKDMIAGEILAFWISDNLSMNIIQKTFKQLNTKFKYQDLKWALIHSDQWFHYTHPYFQRQVQALGCIQSMSRKGNCIDNAPTESFFWHFKDEIDISIYETLEEVEKYTEQYIFYYNNYRPQWTRKKMTPVQYRNHLLQNQS